MQHVSAHIQAHLALTAVALIYGGNYIIAKEVMDQDYMQPLGFVMLRAITGTALFFLFHALIIKEKLQRNDLGIVALCGLFGVAVNQGFFFSGLERTTPIHAALLMTTTPILVLIISQVVLRERITRRKIMGILSGLAGALLLITQGEAIGFSKAYLAGDLMILVNAMSYGIYLVLVKRLLVRYHPLTVIKWVFGFGMLYLIPFGARQLSLTDWSSFTPAIWLALLYVLIFVTFLAYLLNIFAMRSVSPNVVSIYIYLQPLLAATLSLFLGKEEFTGMKGVAGLCIFLGVYLVSVADSTGKNKR